MPKNTREEAQGRRAASRERRRSGLSQPFEEMKNAVTDGAQNEADTMASAKRAVRTAAGAAVAGGLAGAAKALLDRRGQVESDDEDDESDEQAAVQGENVSAEHDPAQSQTDDTAENTAPDTTDDSADDNKEVEEPQQGASSSDVAAMVQRAREQITDLLDKAPESISGIRHVNGSWSVTVEVVEIHRIPDTTDILSSYELVLDDNGDLVRLDRLRRYRRSQVEEDR